MNSHRIRIVGSFGELIATPFGEEINALCWPRQLPGDFQEIIDQLQAEEGMTTIADGDLRALNLTAAGAVARDGLVADLAMMRCQGLAPTLD